MVIQAASQDTFKVWDSLRPTWLRIQVIVWSHNGLIDVENATAAANISVFSFLILHLLYCGQEHCKCKCLHCIWAFIKRKGKVKAVRFVSWLQPRNLKNAVVIFKLFYFCSFYTVSHWLLARYSLLGQWFGDLLAVFSFCRVLVVMGFQTPCPVMEFHISFSFAFSPFRKSPFCPGNLVTSAVHAMWYVELIAN